MMSHRGNAVSSSAFSRSTSSVAYRAGATGIFQQVARKRSEHAFMTLGACKRLAFQSVSVALQIANARVLRSRRSLVFLLPSSLNYQDQRASAEKTSIMVSSS
jgi:hypothetical protein